MKYFTSTLGEADLLKLLKLLRLRTQAIDVTEASKATERT